jgi:hypothetical protein
MSRKAKSLQRWSELANPALKLLGLYEEPRHSNVATVTASLGTAGALAAAFLMREPLGRLSRSLLAEGTALVEHLSIAEVLSVAGLERRRSALSAVGPALGALFVGSVAGALAANWVRSRNENVSVEASPYRVRPDASANSPTASMHVEAVT